MALEWMALSLVAAGEAILLILLTMPVLHGLRKGLIQVSQSMMQPLLAGVPLALFLGLDIWWKLQNMAPLQGYPGEIEKHSKMIFKSQRNGLLVFTSLFFYWILYRVTRILIRLDQLTTEAARLKGSE